MTKTMMQDAMSNESTERVKRVVNDYACKVHIFKVFLVQDQFVLGHNLLACIRLKKVSPLSRLTE